MLNHFSKYIRGNTLELRNLKLLSKQCCSNRRYNTSKRIIPNLNTQNVRYLHLNNLRHAKQFVESENSYASKVLQSFPVVMNLADTKIETNKTISKEHEFNTFLDQNWRSATASDITRAFLSVTNYCQENNINISDNRFDKLVDGLMDNVEKLTTNELRALLECLIKLPPTEAYYSHNFHDVWSALDDICCWKMKDWDVETLYKFAELWRTLNLGKIGDYIFEFLDRLCRKPDRLSQQGLVHAFFYMNVCRRRPIEFEFEDAINNTLDTLTVDEIAIIAMGFFKTQTKVKMASILNRMIELVIQNSKTVHEISLAAILKVVRMSQHPETSENIIVMLDKITPQIPRLSHLCATHAALTGTSLQIFHEPILKAVAQKTVDNISDTTIVRLKDIERMLLAMTMFDYDPKTTPDFYDTLYKELHRNERIPEKVRHPKCIPCALTFLSIRNIYSEQLMNEVLDPHFITENYGKNNKRLPRELFFLDLSKEIDVPDYKLNKWSLEMRQRACKWLLDSVPSEDSKRKLSISDKLYIDVIDTVTSITGDKKFLYIGHVLPHFVKPVIVLCVDKATNKFVEPSGFRNYTVGEIMRPYEPEKYKWYSIVVVSFNLTVRNTYEPTGNVNMKKRHLKTIGYEPILVRWNEYRWLQGEEKMDYILAKIKQL